jgi:hypothetical protein
MIEIVFLPYIASMWDCMESVWRAANADPNCRALVIPVPYYEKRALGGLGEMHYEGALFPSDVPIIDYKTYDFAKRLPDIVYMHNPYDGDNRVTNVHPDFYTSRIRQYTHMLVYLPYGAGGSQIAPSGMAKLGAFKRFDRIILETEALRKVFIRNVPASKVIALGSPKFDKIVMNRDKPAHLSAELARRVEGKRIVLYNTTLQTILESGTAFPRKIKSVIKAFRGRPDFVLWWRPHPLSAATIRSMRPQLLGDYMQIVRGFKENDMGVYDDTADLHRAISAADAYYGDDSSLKQLFGLTGKPLVFQMVREKQWGGASQDPTAAYLVPYKRKERSVIPLEREDFIILEQNASGAPCDFLREYIPLHAKRAADQIEAFSRNIVNADGTAGAKIHEYIREQLAHT